MSYKVSSLPKWAQSRIRLLEKEVEYWKDKTREIEEGDTNVFQEDYAGPPPYRTPMMRDTRIVFITDETEYRVGLQDGGHQLEVMSSRGIKSRLAVMPIAANLIQIQGIE